MSGTVFIFVPFPVCVSKKITVRPSNDMFRMDNRTVHAILDFPRLNLIQLFVNYIRSPYSLVGFTNNQWIRCSFSWNSHAVRFSIRTIFSSSFCAATFEIIFAACWFHPCIYFYQSQYLEFSLFASHLIIVFLGTFSCSIKNQI